MRPGQDFLPNSDRIDSCVYFCFLLSEFGDLTESAAGDIIMASDPSSYFDVMSNTGFMEERGLISSASDKCNETVFSLLDAGKELAESFESSLPPLLKAKTLSAGKEILTRRQRERSILCEISYDHTKERYELIVKFLNEINGDIILEIKLFAPDERSAKEMKERFLSKPYFIISRTMNMFLRDDYFMYDNNGGDT